MAIKHTGDARWQPIAHVVLSHERTIGVDDGGADRDAASFVVEPVESGSGDGVPVRSVT